MPVKHWSFAGLMLTYWCNASCASCYLGCGPRRREEMSVEAALAFWRSLHEAGPHGCRVHLSGGEPFGDWPRLIEICRRAKREGLGPLQKVETNALWATDAAEVRDRLRALDDAGMQKLSISADPYHQQFVPIERCRLAARLAGEVLGPGRVQVRWRDWLADGQDTGELSEADRAGLFARYAAGRRDRHTGRAANLLATGLACKSPDDLADNSCREALLRSRHVHVGPDGSVFPGTCAGILLGSLAGLSDGEAAADARQLRLRLADDHAARPIVGTLTRAGPAGLLAEARDSGFRPREAYADKCHLCWEVRKWFVRCGWHGQELGPAGLYQS